MSPDACRPWIRTLRPEAHQRLICLSYAGGGAAAYRGWAEALPSSIDVAPIVLPGRETRMSEPPVSDVQALVQAMAPMEWP